MPIDVKYEGFKPKDQSAVNVARARERMSRDASWGTYSSNLAASETTCGPGSEARWKAIEPTIDAPLGGATEVLTARFHDESFFLEEEGVDHFVATVAGDIVASPELGERFGVTDFELIGDSYASDFPGPRFGIDGIRQLLAGTLQGERRPILAFTVKPRRGHTTKDLEKIFVAASAAQIDIVEDDERLVSSRSCRFVDRVSMLSKAQKTGGTRASLNITGDSRRALDRLMLCIEKGIQIVKIDVLVCGFEVLRLCAQRIREVGAEVAITVYPDAYPHYRRLRRPFILRLARLCGADIVYAGSPAYSRFGVEGVTKEDFVRQLEELFRVHKMLRDPLPGAPGAKSTLPTLTNDMHPQRGIAIAHMFRRHCSDHRDYAFFVGGGIAAYPRDLGQSCDAWRRALVHSSRGEAAQWAPFDFGDVEADFEKLGWRRPDVSRLLSS